MKKIYLKTMVFALGLLGWSATANAQYYSEGFESGAFPPGWVLTNGTDDWQVGDGTSDGPGAAHTGTYAAYFDDYNYSGGTTADMITPDIDLSSATAPQLKFWYWDGDGSDVVEVLVSMDGVTYTSVFTTPSTVSSWTKYTIDLSAYVGSSTVTVAFRGTSVYGLTDPNVDDIAVDEVPACPDITGLTLAGLSTTTADISWTAGGTETSWNIEWGASGFAPGTGADLGSATYPSTAYTITGLTGSTNYDVYVQADCGGAGTATWVGPLSIYTSYCEYSGGSPYEYINDFSTTGGASTNISNLNSGYSTNGYQDATAMSVDSYIGSDVNFSVSFYQPNYTFGFNIWVDWNNNLTFEASEKVYASGSYVSSPTVGTISIPVGTPIGNYRMRIANDDYTSDPDPCSSGYDKEVEDYTFTVVATPSCPHVTDLSILTTYTDSANVTWTAGGLETSWNLEWGTPGFVPGTGASLGAVTYPTTAYMITGLSPNTHYDVYVQANCGSGDLATWYGPLDVYTGYCEYSGGSPSYYINNFSTTGGIPTNISNLNSGFATNGYQDATNMSVSSYEGASINFNMTFGSQSYYSFGAAIWVDWNNDLIFDASEQVYSSGYYVTSATGSITIPVGTALGDHRMRVAADENNTTLDPCASTSYKEVEDYTFTVVAVPDCLPITGLTVDNVGLDTVQVSWTAGGVETSWNIQWGNIGFTPGTSTEIGAGSSPTTTYTVTGLNPSTTYDIYVQANCSSSTSDSSYWELVQATTLCGPAALPWSENFDAMTAIGSDIFPNCWMSDNGEWFSDNGSYNSSYSAPYSLSIRYGEDDYIWTPQFNLTAGTTYEFAFRWVGDGYTGWTAGVYYSGSQSSLDAVQIDSNFIVGTQVSPTDYQKEVICFTPDTSGIYSFGVHVSATYNPEYLNFDNFSLRAPSANAGTDGATTVCQISGLVNLNNVISINDTNGVWNFSANPSAIQNDTLFNPASIPSGTTNVYYILNGCIQDSAMATINIYPKSNAGTDGTVSTCNYGPLNLFDGLTGNVDLGGQWYDPSSQPITGDIVNFNGQIAADYNYIYVVSNGVCPADTSVIEIQLQDCAGIDEYALKGFVLYPNPSKGLINIQYSGEGDDVKVDVVDSKGAIIWSKQIQFKQNTTEQIDLTGVENGIYYVNMTSAKGGSVLKVIKD